MAAGQPKASTKMYGPCHLLNETFVCDYIFEKKPAMPAGLEALFGLVMWIFIARIAYDIYNLWPSKERKIEDEIMKTLKGRVLSHNQLFRMFFMAHTISFEDFGKAMDRLDVKGKVSRLLSADMTPMWIPVDKN
jgi:hypothetical protein